MNCLHLRVPPEVAHQELEISDKEFLIAHGKSAWISQEKVQKWQREATGQGLGGVFSSFRVCKLDECTIEVLCVVQTKGNVSAESETVAFI